MEGSMTTQTTNQLVRGSLKDISIQSRTSIAQAFAGAEAMVLLDCSGSMIVDDCPGQRKRCDVARNELIKLQQAMPGKIALVSWNDHPSFCPSGLPASPMGGTDLVAALSFAKRADGCGIKLIVISDGEPDDEHAALRLARQFKTKLDTIYVGPESGEGRDFLRRLAEASGGTFTSNNVAGLAQLAPTITKLITA
jgi:uncharacterized protein with von Willebrand factor type A (vWA) domain